MYTLLCSLALCYHVALIKVSNICRRRAVHIQHWRQYSLISWLDVDLDCTSSTSAVEETLLCLSHVTPGIVECWCLHGVNMTDSEVCCASVESDWWPIYWNVLCTVLFLPKGLGSAIVCLVSIHVHCIGTSDESCCCSLHAGGLGQKLIVCFDATE